MIYAANSQGFGHCSSFIEIFWWDVFCADDPSTDIPWILKYKHHCQLVGSFWEHKILRIFSVLPILKKQLNSNNMENNKLNYQRVEDQ